MNNAYKIPTGWRLNKRMSDASSTCITCVRCGDNQSRYDDNLPELTRSVARHVCSLPTVLRKDLYFHAVPAEWPYASKGQDPATIPTLAKWILALPVTFREELLALLEKGGE